ncbi:hypothetical protein [Streptomyces sp. NPDC093225]|uniref:hypothetical protein n=1 Tax=Streptomyces sp. NPDC093225 TaxID=3366034 RepID=UPI00382E0F6C
MTRTRRRRHALGALVAVSVLSAGLMGAGTPQPATAEPSGPASVSKAALQRQQKLDAVAAQITQNRIEDERYRIPGYAGVVVDGPAGRLTVYWKGAVPQRVREIAAHVPHGLTVRLRPAAYSAADLVAARERLIKATAQGRTPLALGRRWTHLSVPAEGTGLVVGYDRRAARTTGAPAQAEAEVTKAVGVAARRIAGVPVQARPRYPARRMSRQDDWSPWWAGAGMRAPTGYFCSSGFAVWQSNGRPGLLTAAHCGTSGTYYDRTGETIGGVAAARTDRDTTVIDVWNGSVDPGYYDGPWDTNNGKHIMGSNYNNKGDYVCTSGAMTGIHCNLKVYDADTVVRDEVDGHIIGPAILATRTNVQDVAGGKGDSGGPVVTSPDGTYGHDMEARGIISGGDGEIAVCIPGGTAASTRCYEGVAYVAIRRVLADFSLRIAT